MSPFRRALAAWATLMGVFLIIVLAFAAYGERTIRRVEAQRLLGRGEAFIHARRLDEAVASLEQALGVKPSLYAARRLLVVTLLQAGRAGEAVTRAQAAAEECEEANRLDALLLLGRAKLEAGREAEAEQAYDRAVALAPNSAEALYELGRIYEARGQYARASEAMQRLVRAGTGRSTPEFVEAFNGRLDQAQRLKALADKADASAATLYRAGCLWMELGRWSEAERALGRCAALPNAPADAFFRLGALAEARGDGAAAMTLYGRALEAAPDHRAALAGLLRGRASEGGP